MTVRIAVLASGGGTNLQALIDRFNGTGSSALRVELVVGSRSGIGALERAEHAGIPNVVPVFKRPMESVGSDLLRLMDEHEIGLIVLAGFLQLVPPALVRAFEGRIVNIHPALLPAFGGKGMYGIRVHRAVLESGARVSGATVHLIDEEYDRGSILAQWPVPVLSGDLPETLAARVLKVEHMLLPMTLEVLAGARAATSLAEPAAFDLVAQPLPPAESLTALLPSNQP